ncbi:MAG: UvrD-helicase domain-containing protein, partial [Methanobacterium sp.]
MIEYADFEDIVVRELERDIRYSINSKQNEAIWAPLNTSLFIAAGPGSGKTTVMVLKILKFIFIDNVEPSSIIATTFTRKAASELKSRVIDWGNKLKSELTWNPKYYFFRDHLNSIDLRKVIVGTIDSISEEVLRNSTNLEDSSYTIIEDFVANSLMIKTGILKTDLGKDRQLKSFLNHIKGSRSRLNMSTMSQILLEVKDRVHHDRINLKDFIDKYDHPGAVKALEAISCYEKDLEKRHLLDFSTLEEELLKKLQNNELQNFLERIKIVMVDEYQDTNLLQESIYFEMAHAAIKNGGSIVVVGDDDQSLYRFRGASVDLFKDFKERIQLKLDVEPHFINLSQNYRSTENIVDFCNSYIAIDEKFQDARVQGKETIVSYRKKPYSDIPVLGMFREDIKTLSKDLADFIHKILEDKDFDLSTENEFKIKIDEKEGSPGDIALLCSSPMEQDFKGNLRLSCLLKDELGKYNPQISVFNPRGQHLGRIPLIELICGLILECIDPEGKMQSKIRPPRNAFVRFKRWRDKALNYIDQPENEKIKIFRDTWKNELEFDNGEIEIPVADLIGRIIQLKPEIRDDDEFVYVEIITKTITQTGLFSDFKSNIILDKSREKMNSSTIEAIWNIFVPIALGAVKIDLDVLEDVPKNRVNIMSIHQSKGLEFPIVIVDVGSDF